MNALDTALVKLAAASTALECHAPALTDVKDAVENAKAAAKILDAAYVLMTCGVYTVAEAPSEAKFVDPKDYRIEMPEVVAEAPTRTALELLQSWEGRAEEDRLQIFHSLLADLSSLHANVSGLEEPLDVTPLLNLWESEETLQSQGARLDSFQMAVYCLFNQVFELVPNPVEVGAWVADVLVPKKAPMPDVLIQFDNWEEEDAALEFDRRLDLLAEGLDCPDYDSWDAAWDADHKMAFTKLLLAEEREPKAFALPTDEEVAVFLAQFEGPIAEANTIPEHITSFRNCTTLYEQKEAFFTLLSEYESAGMEEGLKAKAFKTLYANYCSCFDLNPEDAWNRLWHAFYTFPLDKWRMPTEKEIQARLIFQSQLEPIDPFEQKGGAE